MIKIPVHLKILRSDEEIVYYLLQEQGMDSFEVRDLKDWQDLAASKEDWVLIEGPEEIGEEIEIILYLEREEEILDLVADLGTYLRSYELGQAVKEEDYLYAWQEFFDQYEIGDLVISPPWKDYQGDKRLIHIDPGLAFGTGNHETTRICLELMQRRDLAGKDFLDIGTGSGILAIAARLLGAKRVLGVDIDPQAVEAARRNSQLNQAPIEVYQGDLLEAVDQPYDLVVANILSSVILRLLGDLASILGDKTQLIFSGILASEREPMLEAFDQHGLRLVEELVDGEWVGFLLEGRHD